MGHATVISRIVGRCHVGQSNLEVLRYVLSRLKGGRKAFLRLPRNIRRSLMRHAFREHRGNRRLYNVIHTGRFS